MRYARAKIGPDHGSIGVEPQPNRGTIEVGEVLRLTIVRTPQQLAEMIGLLQDAGEILGWEPVARK